MKAVALPADVADPASVRALFEDARAALGDIDILVNGAGVAPSAPLVKTTDEQWRQAIEVNLSGAFYCLREALPVHDRAGLGAGRERGVDRGQDGDARTSRPTPPANTACSVSPRWRPSRWRPAG